MPRKPIEWSKCIIYKIWKDDEFYVGSTTDFTNRKRCHKQCCNNEKDKAYNLKIYQTIRGKGGWDAWSITPLEEYKECKSQIEARIREEEWRVKLNANLNMIKAFVVKQEYTTKYYQEHKEEKKEKVKKYQQEHKNEIKEKVKKYYQEHKNEKKEKNTQYYQKHKEELNAKCVCECGGKYSKQHKSQHEKSIKHQTYLISI